MSDIRVNSPEYKVWKKRNDAKKNRERLRKKKIHRKNQKNKRMGNEIENPYKTFYVPEVFSIIKNPEETIKFLNDIIEQVEKIRKSSRKIINNNIKTFALKMDYTKEITGDALMYLLTIIKNTRGKKILPINWWGNFPKEEKMKQFLQNSGYLKYMQTSKENLVKTNEHIQIQFGHGYEYQEENNVIDIRQKIIDFTCQKLNKNKTQVNFLMTMLTEMITNIQDHAYDKENLFEHSWYIFVENKEDKIAYTFMDNGLGIPTTITKKGYEKFLGKLDLDKEYRYIEAAISGLEKRSQTGLVERGNGLPSIYEQYTSKKVSTMAIISNRAYYIGEKGKDLENNLNGTIFYWEVEKEETFKYGN